MVLIKKEFRMDNEFLLKLVNLADFPLGTLDFPRGFFPCKYLMMIWLERNFGDRQLAHLHKCCKLA